MIILNISNRLYPSDNNKHIRYPFLIETEAQQLIIKFMYSPATLDDRDKAVEMIMEASSRHADILDEKIENHLPLRNLITLSLDSPKGWVGTAHRHMLRPQEHIIAKDKASRGFFSQDIVKGEWFITLSVNTILTDFTDVQLSVEAVYA